MCLYLNIYAFLCSLHSHLSGRMYRTEWILQQAWRVHVSRWQLQSEHQLKCHLVIETQTLLHVINVSIGLFF